MPQVDPRRFLPKVDDLVDSAEVVSAGGGLARWVRVELARRVLAELRAEPSFSPDQAPKIAQEALATSLVRLRQPGPNPIWNATGVPLHTNLGRAPLAKRVREAMSRAGGYTDLEMNLEQGVRGNRLERVSEQLSLLTGAEAGCLVNNNAAAVLLVARALAKGGEILVSRGELVEIGGSFRIPEVVESAGAKLVEVGSTNRTHLKDFERAISPQTRLILKVHRSNFRIEGFTKSASRQELSELARSHELPFAEDLGSGCFEDLKSWDLPPEPTPRGVLSQGVDVVTFSGDKLLGGLQAGLIAGEESFLSKIRKDPLMRALRLDKVATAGVQASLGFYLEEEGARGLPFWEMIATPLEVLATRAQELASELRAVGYRTQVLLVEAPVGAGSLPGASLSSFAVALTLPGLSEESLAQRLRSPIGAGWPILPRIEKGQVLLDLRTLVDFGGESTQAEDFRTRLKSISAPEEQGNNPG